MTIVGLRPLAGGQGTQFLRLRSTRALVNTRFTTTFAFSHSGLKRRDYSLDPCESEGMPKTLAGRPFLHGGRQGPKDRALPFSLLDKRRQPARALRPNIIVQCLGSRGVLIEICGDFRWKHGLRPSSGRGKHGEHAVCC
jgi:hypothetical protein